MEMLQQPELMRAFVESKATESVSLSAAASPKEAELPTSLTVGRIECNDSDRQIQALINGFYGGAIKPGAGMDLIGSAKVTFIAIRHPDGPFERLGDMIE